MITTEGIWDIWPLVIRVATKTFQKVKIKISLGEKRIKSLNNTGRDARGPEYCLNWPKIY